MGAPEKGTQATKAAEEAKQSVPEYFKYSPYSALNPETDPYLKSIPKRKKGTGTTLDYLKGYVAGWPGMVGDLMDATEPFRAITLANKLMEVPTTEELGEIMAADTDTDAFKMGILGIPGLDDLLLKGGGKALLAAGPLAKIAKQDYVQVYHGFPTDVLDDVKAGGIKASGGRERGATFATPKPDIAMAYIEKGGEKSLKGRRKVPTVPDDERAVAVLRIPKAWYDKHVVQTRTSGLTPEVGFDESIPKEFIHEIVVGDRKKVYSLPTTELPKK